MAEKAQKRNSRDKSKVTLREGEQQRPSGTFAFRWTDERGKRRESAKKRSPDNGLRFFVSF